ncbi:MAG: peptidoglycan DD-metalloendopeptidase family protein [Anaerolineae bacterium]
MHRLLVMAAVIIGFLLVGLFLAPVVFAFEPAYDPPPDRPTPEGNLPPSEENPGSGGGLSPVEIAEFLRSVDEELALMAGESQEPQRSGVIIYIVEPGDTVWSIASRFGLDIDTLRWSNEELERNPDLLWVGQKLTILPIPGAYHTVQEGQTLSQIAEAYGVAMADIINYALNDLREPYRLREGQKLVIPYGRKRTWVPSKPALSPESPFAWPISGRITRGYGPDHHALDIGAPYGSPVYAARDGRVIHTGWARTGYGYMVILDHGNGLQSLYSHLKGTWVVVGQWVARGQIIGEVGSTGKSSGPHVHFEIRQDRTRVDPTDYLPASVP